MGHPRSNRYKFNKPGLICGRILIKAGSSDIKTFRVIATGPGVFIP